MPPQRRGGYYVRITPLPQQNANSGQGLGFVLAVLIFVVVVGAGLKGLGFLPAFALGTDTGAPTAAQKTSFSQKASSGGGTGTADGARILAEARKHDYESYVYGGGHPPSTYSNGDGVDCSGLIDVVLLRLYGINENNTAAGFQYSGHWKRISKTSAQPGDIMYILQANHPGRGDDHVVIMVQNNGPGRNPTIFEAYGTGGGSVPQPDQIRVSSARSFDAYDGALRFVR